MVKWMSGHRYVSDVLAEANHTANWERARALYDQIRHIRGSRVVPDDLRGEFSECLIDLAATYRNRRNPFVAHTLAVLAAVDRRETFDADLFVDAYRNRVGLADHTPSLFETVVETSRRLRDAGRAERALRNGRTSCILCGSVSYGQFYNVRGHHGDEPSSDLDIIIVIDDVAELHAMADGLSGLSGMSAAEIERFRTRVRIFTERYDNGATSLSHKFRMWHDNEDELLTGTGLRGDYTLSLHVLTRSTLDYILVESSTTLGRATAGAQRTVLDYRDTPTNRRDLPRSFSGREYEVPPEITEAEQGWLRKMTVYLFDEGDRYCVGFLQTLLMPASELFWDALDVRRSLDTFVRKLRDRYRHEQGREPLARLRLSLTHVRRDLFAPHVLRRFDAGE